MKRKPPQKRTSAATGKARRKSVRQNDSQQHKYDSTSLDAFIAGVNRRNPNEPEFQQAVREVAETIIPYLSENPRYVEEIVLERMTEPDRIIVFRVNWDDDQGRRRINRGYRVQFNNAIGPYKGGLRFHPTVNLSVLKFLAFEQTFKNALTTLPLGAAKGGADFNPRDKSDREINRFCRSFMSHLFKYIGPNIDVPAGDIGVGTREIGYLFGQYKNLTGEFASGTITGKGIEYGGSLTRNEATGYGVIYFTQEVFDARNRSIEGQKCAISGSGNVAQYAAEKAAALGAAVLTLSDSSGFIYDKAGIDQEKLEFVKKLKNVRRGRISEYADKYRSAQFHEGKRPWGVPCDIAIPCATQNELDLADAERLVGNGCGAVTEGANMPTTIEAQHYLRKHAIFSPAKAANAGGVAVSGLEMSQNSLRISWTHEEVDLRLREIMRSIHMQCVHYGRDKSGTVDYVSGSNIAGFVKVANAMLAHGI